MDNKPAVVIRDDRSRATAAGAEGKSLAQWSEAEDWAGVPVPRCTGARISSDDNKVSDTAEDEGETEDGSTQFGENAEWSDTSSDNGEVDSSCSVSDGAAGEGGKVGSSPSNRHLSNNTRSAEAMGRHGCRGRVRGEGARFGRRIRTQRKNSDVTIGSHSEDVLKDKSGVPRTLSPSLRRRVNETALMKRERSDASVGVSESDSVTSSSGLDNGDESDDATDTDDLLEPTLGEVKLVPSIFPDRPPTVFFEYPKELGMTRSENAFFTEPLGDRRLLFKTHWERNSVKNAFFRAGFTRTTSTFSWTASWGKHPTHEGYKNLNRFQKVNHFPGSWCIGRKDRLLRTLARQKRDINSAAAAAATAAAAAAAAAREASGAVDRSSKGGEGGNGGTGYSVREVSTALSMVNPVDIAPEGFVLPGDRRAWMKTIEADPKAIWIVKPPASSCGRGIRVISKATAGRVNKSRKCLVQRYIHNPMLIDGRKFDLRLYVLVTSMEPLRVYLFEEGLVRLSTKKYSLKNLRSRYAHLTNYSINKTSASFKAPDDSDGQEATPSTRASKWALTIFWKYFENMFGIEKSKEVQRSIDDIVLRTMAAADGDMTISAHQVNRHRGCCYELFGFDVLLDEHLRPWLLEVNISPSALDRRIKGTLMADIFHLVGFRPFDRTALRREERKEARRLPGTRRAVRAMVGKPQDAWRRCQTPASIKLSDLCEDEWEVIRDTEDEKHRAGKFRILYPTAENVIRLWPIFRSPRFLNGVLARWVLTGGLSNLSNRADIGLTAERLFFRKEMAYAGFGQRKYTGSGLGTRTGGVGDGRWEETTSNATTLLSTGGAKLGSDGFSSSRSPRPASSATSRASQHRKRPLWRGANAKIGSTVGSPGTASGGVNGGGLSSKQPSDGRFKGEVQGSKRTGKMPGMRVCRSGVKGIGESAAVSRKLSNVPKLHRNDDERSKGPSLRMIRPNAQLARINGGNHCSNGGNLDGSSALRRSDDRPSSVLKVRRASSALGSRSSTGQSSVGEGGQRDGGVTAGISAFKDTGWGSVVGDQREASATSRSETSKGRETSRRRSSQAAIFQERARKHVTESALNPTLYGHANLNSGASEAVSSTEVALVNGCHFPRPPQPTPRCAADEMAGKSNPLNTFSVALLRSGRSRFASKDGAATSGTLSAAPFRCHALPDTYEGSRAGSNKIHQISPPGSMLEPSRAPTDTSTEIASLISHGTPGEQHHVEGPGATNHHPRRVDVKEGTTEPFDSRSDHSPSFSLRGTRRGSQSVAVHEFEAPRLDKVGFTPRLDKRFSSDRRFSAAKTTMKPSAATAVTARSTGP